MLHYALSVPKLSGALELYGRDIYNYTGKNLGSHEKSSISSCIHLLSNASYKVHIEEDKLELSHSCKESGETTVYLG